MPHFSTISYIFNWILMEMVDAGYVDPGVVWTEHTYSHRKDTLPRCITYVISLFRPGYVNSPCFA